MEEDWRILPTLFALFSAAGMQQREYEKV